MMLNSLLCLAEWLSRADDRPGRVTVGQQKGKCSLWLPCSFVLIYALFRSASAGLSSFTDYSQSGTSSALPLPAVGLSFVLHSTLDTDSSSYFGSSPPSSAGLSPFPLSASSSDLYTPS